MSDTLVAVHLSGECDKEAFCTVAVPVPIAGPVEFSTNFVKNHFKSADPAFEFGVIHRINRDTRQRTALSASDEVMDLEFNDYIYELGPTASYALFALRLRHRRLVERAQVADKANQLLDERENEMAEKKDDDISTSVHIRFPSSVAEGKHSSADLHLHSDESGGEHDRVTDGEH